jgi:hypothetical protein
MNSIWIKDEDSHRKVYLGAQEDVPPKRLHLANFFVDREGRSRQSHMREYRLVEQNNNEYVYSEVTPYT